MMAATARVLLFMLVTRDLDSDVPRLPWLRCPIDGEDYESDDERGYAERAEVRADSVNQRTLLVWLLIGVIEP